MLEIIKRGDDPVVSSQDIYHLRKQIESVDEEVLRLLERRVDLAKKVGEVKGDASVYDPSREMEIIERLCNLTKELDPKFVSLLFREIISFCRAVQKPIKVACMGPEGSFSHEAVVSFLGRFVDVVFVENPAEVFDHVSKEKAGIGVVPVENTTEGTVYSTLDAFATAEQSISVIGEGQLPIRLALASEEKTTADIEEVYSHPQPFGQCRNWLYKNLPWARQIPTSSTSYAAKIAKTKKKSAAICGRLAAELYELNILDEGIEDHPYNATRFWLIGRAFARSSERCKTSILFNVAHKPGTLFQALEPLYKAGLNLTLIQSRPLPGNPFEYFFFVDFEGDVGEEKVKEALAAMRSRVERLRVLGSYPQIKFIK